MSDAVNVPQGAARDDWALRPWLLAGIGALTGLLIYLVTRGNDTVPWQMATAAFLFFGSIALAFTLEDGRWKAPSLFALAIGLVMAGLTWRAVRYGDSLPDEHYGFAAGVVASGLALPLFQAGFVKNRMATSYADLHHHVWTDAISAAGAVAFTGLSWLVLLLLSELFHLLKIDLLRNLLDDGWFGWTFSGLAFGAALGTLRNQTRILGTMQTVVLLVLSLLAVPLAIGLVVFLLATAVSGPQVLWEATRSATPLLLMCAAGAWVLASTIVRYEDTAMSRNRVMRVAALVLAAVILPLAVFAAFSMGLRLNQYGLAPERLWGLIAIIVACAYGVGFWGALIRGRKGQWAEMMRRANFHLGLFVCAFALLLALPIFDFGAISTRNQIARLESGKVSAEDFDYSALRWDFGKAGQRALERLAKGDGATAEGARKALAEKNRVWYGPREPVDQRAERLARLQMTGSDAQLRTMVEDWLETQPWRCSVTCAALDLGTDAEGHRRVAFVEGDFVEQLAFKNGVIVEAAVPNFSPSENTDDGRVPTIEVRPFTGRQIYRDGKPVGEPFE